MSEAKQRSRQRQFLGDILLSRGVIDDWQLDTALQEQWNRRPTMRLGRLLVELGFVDVNSLYSALACQNHLPETVL